MPSLENELGTRCANIDSGSMGAESHTEVAATTTRMSRLHSNDGGRVQRGKLRDHIGLVVELGEKKGDERELSRFWIGLRGPIGGGVERREEEMDLD